MDEFEFYGDQPGDYDMSGSYGNVSNLFDFDLSSLFNSFSPSDLGFDLADLNLGDFDLSSLDLDMPDLTDAFTFDDLSQYVDFDETLPSDNIDITGVGSTGEVDSGTGQNNYIDQGDFDNRDIGSGVFEIEDTPFMDTPSVENQQRPTSVTYTAQQFQNEDVTDPLGRNSVMITDQSGEVVAAIDANGQVVKGNLEVRTSENPRTGQVEYQYVDQYGNVIGGFDEEGNWFNGYGTESTVGSTSVVSGDPGRYAGSNNPLGGTPEKTFGGNLANKSDVDKLLGSNAGSSGGGGGGVTRNDVKNSIVNPTNKSPWPAILGGVLGALTSPKVGGARGYQGSPAGLTASRTALSPSGAPGSGGKRFISQTRYAADGGLMTLQPNQNVMFMSAGGLPSKKDYESYLPSLTTDDANNYDRLISKGMAPSQAIDALSQLPAGKSLAKGGISSLGSYSDGGRMLKGPGDGMSDSIPASIGGKRPARLADGEFVVPADVVSHLGNGSTDAGADVLYEMMERVRKARTGNPKQGRQINPKKFAPKVRN